MRYGFINNFSQTLAAELAAGATTMTLDGGGALLASASADLVYALTLDDGAGTVEIVHVTGAAGDTLTIVRGQEGTGDVLWPVGSTVELRLTAGSISVGLRTAPGGGARGANALEWQGSRSNEEQVAAGNNSIAIGNNTKALGNSTIVMGQNAELLSDTSGYGHILITPDSYGISAGQGSCVFIGTDLWTDYKANSVICLGYNFFPNTGSLTTQWGLVVGEANYLRSNCGARATLLGHRNTQQNTEFSTAIGDNNTIQNARMGLAAGVSNKIAGSSAAFPDFDRCIAFGFYNDLSGIPLGVAIGNGIEGLKPGTKKISGLSYLQSPSHYPVGGSALSPNEPDYYRWAGEQVVLVTKDIDLTLATDEQVFTLPAGLHFFVDEIDIIAVSVATPGGAPSLDVGVDAAAPASVLSAEGVTANTASSRQKAAPLTSDGLNTLRIGVNTAGSGTWVVRVVLKGLAMEI